MMKEEFAKLVSRPFTDSEYEVIERVYIHYPSISNTEGKLQVAYLYDTFGICIFNDMLSRANMCADIENKILTVRGKLDKLKEQLDDLKSSPMIF